MGDGLNLHVRLGYSPRRVTSHSGADSTAVAAVDTSVKVYRLRRVNDNYTCKVGRFPTVTHQYVVLPLFGTSIVQLSQSASLVAKQFNGVKIPTSLSDIDNGNILSYGSDLAEDHPVDSPPLPLCFHIELSAPKGFHDLSYKLRRRRMAEMAKQHTIGEPIEVVDYTPEERETWKSAYLTLKTLYPENACSEFNKSFAQFGLSEERVPQLQELSDTIYSATGWSIRPVVGMMNPRDFLNSFAFQTLHSTQYMRHHSTPMYSPEPDLVHEVLGHMAMLMNPHFCRILHAIGIASLGASKELATHLTKVYWYTVEFGVVHEADKIKAFGAGILSSYGELQWMADKKATIIPFDPCHPLPKMHTKDGFQKQYFALESFEKGAALLEEYAARVSTSIPTP